MPHNLFVHSFFSNARVWTFLKQVDAAEAQACRSGGCPPHVRRAQPLLEQLALADSLARAGVGHVRETRQLTEKQVLDRPELKLRVRVRTNTHGHPEFNWRDLPTCMLHEHESRGGEFVLDTNAVETFLGHKVIHGALRSGGDGLLRLARSAFAHRWGAWWNSAPRASNATRAGPQAVSVSESIVSSTAAVVGSWPLFARSSRFTASRAAAANGTPAPRQGGRCSLPVHVFSDFSLDCDNRRVEAHWRLPDWRFMLPFGCRSPFALGADQDMLGLHSRTMDKAKAEVGVQIVQRWILAALRHRTFFSSANSTPRSPSSSSDSTRGRSASESLRVFRRLILVCRTAFMRVPRANDTRLPLHYVACGLQSLPKRSAARLSAMRAADSCTESRAR